MKDIGEQINKMSMQTDEGDDDAIFMASLAQAMQIATAMIKQDKKEPSKPITELVHASERLALITIDTILK